MALKRKYVFRGFWLTRLTDIGVFQQLSVRDGSREGGTNDTIHS